MAWPAFGIPLDSCSFVIEPVGLFAALSLALPLDEDDDADEDVSELLDDDVAPVGALDVELLGWPAPVGVSAAAGSGGGVDEELVDGVTGGVALVSVA